MICSGGQGLQPGCGSGGARAGGRGATAATAAQGPGDAVLLLQRGREGRGPRCDYCSDCERAEGPSPTAAAAVQGPQRDCCSGSAITACTCIHAVRQHV